MDGTALRRARGKMVDEGVTGVGRILGFGPGHDDVCGRRALSS